MYSEKVIAGRPLFLVCLLLKCTRETSRHNNEHDKHGILGFMHRTNTRGAMRQTTRMMISLSRVAVAAAAVTLSVAVADGVESTSSSSTSLLSSDVNSNASA